jgi:hypothetical protein
VLVAAFASSAHADAPGASIADRLSRRWAPVYVQYVATDDHGKDRPTRIDFDGNWDATDNWDHQGRLGTALPPAAYGAAILTDSYAYLTYSLFYPRDWATLCISLICHDNDLETVQLVVARDGEDGKLVELRTKAHHSITDTPARDVARTPDGHPVLRVEAHGHGIAVCHQGDASCEPKRGRIIYQPARVASSPPVAAEGQRVNYELISLHDSLWPLRHSVHGKLWTDGESGPMSYVGKRQGRLGDEMGASMAGNRYVGGVRPPWALAGAFGKRGDWFLDPAGNDPSSSARYVYNPYLDDLATECTGKHCKPAPRERSRFAYFFKLGAPYLALVLGSVAVGSVLRLHVKGLRF